VVSSILGVLGRAAAAAPRATDGTAVEPMQVKTGTYVWLPAHKTLREHLAKTGIDGGYLPTKKLGKGPFTSESPGNMMSIACAEVGCRCGTCGGRRYSGRDHVSVGHSMQEMACLYVQQAHRKIMAKNAMKKWEPATNESR